ncbi:tRNA (adenosine(37)-N6)-dimethylallyltransferase MiaA [Candidatus Microgenomates bacterium]|nr:tRNA (adenosine(37)-N6)-dimethylallyltransferase MiaA [Candidatus Microgenomates bacterium]
MNKLLIVCGPTGTGKTDLALKLAKKFDGEIISADSRQVYRGLDIGTGKDLPKDSKIGFSDPIMGARYNVSGINIWGYDLIGPKDIFSVGQYVEIADEIIGNILDRGKLPILVGGTGFYIKAVVDGIATAKIPQNKNIRKTLEGKNITELFDILAQFDPIRAANMNQSDRNNPRRLMRSIEIAQQGIRVDELKTQVNKYECLFIGLQASKEAMETKVESRVQNRIEMGIEEEIKKLILLGVNWNDQSMTSLGYAQWRDYFENRKTKQEVKEEWVRDEMKYIKKQMVWFKKENRINWFNVMEGNLQKKVEKLVQKWYLS